MEKIVKVTGYSKKEEEYNPAIKDFVRAFREYKPEGRIKGMKPKSLDYLAFILIATGILGIVVGLATMTLFVAGWLFVTAGIILSFISSGLSDL